MLTFVRGLNKVVVGVDKTRAYYLIHTVNDVGLLVINSELNVFVDFRDQRFLNQKIGYCWDNTIVLVVKKKRSTSKENAVEVFRGHDQLAFMNETLDFEADVQRQCRGPV